MEAIKVIGLILDNMEAGVDAFMKSESNFYSLLRKYIEYLGKGVLTEEGDYVSFFQYDTNSSSYEYDQIWVSGFNEGIFNKELLEESYVLKGSYDILPLLSIHFIN